MDKARMQLASAKPRGSLAASAETSGCGESFGIKSSYAATLLAQSPINNNIESQNNNIDVCFVIYHAPSDGGSRMKRSDRQQAITDLLVAEGEVDLDDLAARFGVSRMTIHRDLDDLESAGVLRKIRGGATIRAGTQFESDFRIRERQDSGAKAAMAEAALDLVEPGMTVMVNDGSM